MTATTAAPARQTRPRIALWDNARFALILLVVIGHVVSTVRTDSPLGFGLYAYIYLFHMPAMILLSGMFSRPETTPKAVKSTVQLAVIWLLWEGIWALAHLLTEGKGLGKGFLVSPAWTLWFLVTLVTMRLLLPYIARLRHPLVVSSALALLGGLSPVIGTEFSAARTLTFLPFFVLGWMARDRGWLDGRWFTHPTPVLRGLGWAVLGGVALVFVLEPRFRDFWRIDRWLTWRDDYLRVFERAPIGDWQPEGWLGTAAGGIPIAAALLLIAALMTFALLIVLPRRETSVTPWGSRTLYVYLLHGPIVYGLRATGAVELFNSWGALGMLGLVLVATAITALLSMRWVTVVFRPIIEPPVDWLLRRD
ncbi:acyltransferase family protein [Leucobacter ruminantium]|uniref:Acyltransferase family protein n=1 Tax=Leucobacter ruminantium TaxID=1289170 RepID=A0A939LUD4_9MICO|nr:acyltransferase family protein [Leucobacter ruminantium]